jgi:hypothetical protein
MVVGQGLMDKIVDLIINPLILLIFSAGLVLFLWGLFKYMQGLEDSSARTTGRRHMLWGIIGMLIMISVKAILVLSLDAFGITPNDTALGNGVGNAVRAANPFLSR